MQGKDFRPNGISGIAGRAEETVERDNTLNRHIGACHVQHRQAAKAEADRSRLAGTAFRLCHAERVLKP